MRATDLFDTPAIARLQTVVNNFRNGQFSLPDFQRPFVWDDKQRLQLFDSILKGLPIGSFLIWRTVKKIAVKPELEGFQLPQTTSDKTRNYVLDGQQRLFTLFAALSGQTPTDGQRRWPIYLDLEADRSEGDEGRFQFLRRGAKLKNTWMPLSAILNTRELFAFQRKLHKHGHQDLLDRAEEIANIVRDYPLVLVPILTDDLNLVTQSFQRVNSAGTLMSEAHMLRALTYDETFDLSERFSELALELPGRWSQLDEQPFVNILKALSGHSIYQADVEKLQKAMAEEPGLLERAGQGMSAAAEFACKYLNTLGPASLPYLYQFVALAYAAADGASLEEHREKLERWYWITAYTESFTGMPSGQLRIVFEHLRRLCEGRPEQPLPSNLTLTYSRVDAFRSNSVRSLLMMHRLANLQTNGSELLSRGSETFMRLLVKGSASDPANRFLAASEEHSNLRAKLLDLSPQNDRLRARHLLPPSSNKVWVNLGNLDTHAARARAKALQPVLEWRRQELARIEENRVQSLGLVIEE